SPLLDARRGCGSGNVVRRFIESPVKARSIQRLKHWCRSEAAMSKHPKERPASQAGMSRRELLKRSAAASLALPGAAMILEACSKPGTVSSGGTHANGPGVGSYWPAGSADPPGRQDSPGRV